MTEVLHANVDPHRMAKSVSPTQINLDLANGKVTSDIPSPADSGVVVTPGDTSPTSDTVSVGHSTSAVMSTGNGPDTLVSSDSLFTTLADGAVKLRMSDSGPCSEKPISIVTAFKNTVEKAGNSFALGQKRDGAWKKWTYNQYYKEVRQTAKSLIRLGLEPYHGVGIIGFNAPEWFFSDLGAIFAGGFAVGIYTTNSPDAVQYVAHNAECNILVVENDQQLQKVLKVRESLPHLKAIIQYVGSPKQSYPDTYSWTEFMRLGNEIADEVLEARIRNLAPNKCCTLIYTSGTTGNPKGVMLSHDNITWTANVGGRMARLKFGEEVGVSYLPLSHVAAQMLDIYMPLYYGGCCYFAQPDALKGSLANTLKEVHPTYFLGVPRVWEKMQEKLTAIGKQNTGIKRKIAMWGKGVGLKGNTALMNGRTSMPFGWSIANKLVFKKVRNGLGLDRCKFCLTGAAPITRDTLDFFTSLNIPLMELYGMSESSGPHTLSFPWKYRVTSVGVDMPGGNTKLDNPDDEGNGEICMWGRHVFMGYLNMEEKTAEATDADGWLHSGDIGKKDSHGFLYITGRIKELIITAGGENVAPVPIEDVVKEELPCVSNCMLIGDKKKFLSILLTLKSEVDLDTTMPLDELGPDALEWCKSRGSAALTVSDILDSKDEKVLRGIQEGIDKANKRAVSRAQNIQKWSILPRDFSIPGDELGPTLKLKRPVVSKLYKNTIDAFYAE